MEDGYSIIDLETTGFSPSKGDKIIEIGVVKVYDNQIIDEYSTLINPERDISNYNIHGIEPSLITKAPKFFEISDYLKSFINRTTLVAHNAPFDLRFLEKQLFNQKKKLNGICTINLSRKLDSTVPSRKLEVLCDYYDIKINNTHQAISDALATAKLFIKLKTDFIRNYGANNFSKQFASPVFFDHINNYNLTKLEYNRPDAIIDLQKEKTKFQNLIKRIPTDYILNEENENSYLDTLNDVIADRIITDLEIRQLENLINEFDLKKDQILKLHKNYLSEVIKVYLLDGKISEFELTDLIEITQLLGLQKNELDLLIDKIKSEDYLLLSKNINDCKNLKGISICFTGQLRAKLNGNIVDRSTRSKYCTTTRYDN